MNLKEIKTKGAEKALIGAICASIQEVRNPILAGYLMGDIGEPSFFNGLGNKLEEARAKLDEIEEALAELRKLNPAHA